MKEAAFIMCCGILLACGCSMPSPEATPDLQKQVNSAADQPISRERAIAIASKAHKMNYHREGQIETELRDNQYIVVFPVDKSAKPGIRYRGPDYAAKVWIDARTGEVLKAMVGS